MIHLVTGPPGHGKSFYCVRTIVRSLERGRWVATNIELHDDWVRTAARANGLRRLLPGRVQSREGVFAEKAYVTHDLDELVRLRLPGCGRCKTCKAGRRCMREGRGVMVLDEAHMWLNARTWDADDSGRGLTKAQAVMNRLKIVRFFSQHRKLGWEIYLVTQDDANLDSQVRRNFEDHIHLKNMKAYKIPLIGIRPFPVNVFAAVRTWHDRDRTKLGVEVFLLSKKVAGIYDTMATSHGLEWDAPDAIWLGQNGRKRQQEARPAPGAQRGRPAGPQLLPLPPVLAAPEQRTERADQYNVGGI